MGDSGTQKGTKRAGNRAPPFGVLEPVRLYRAEEGTLVDDAIDLGGRLVVDEGRDGGLSSEIESTWDRPLQAATSVRSTTSSSKESPRLAPSTVPLSESAATQCSPPGLSVEQEGEVFVTVLTLALVKLVNGIEEIRKA